MGPTLSRPSPTSGSASTIVACAVSGYHVLRIDGYSRTKHTISNGKFVESRPFSAAGHTWIIKYYPNGILKNSADYISLYLPEKFIKREDLERSGRLKDDCFTIRCDMIVLGKVRSEDTVTSSIVVPPPDWPQHFRALLLSEQGADVRFMVGDEAFAAHRCVLAARSPVFKADLFGRMKEGTTTMPCIQIDDMAPQVFKTLLHFIYTDSLPEIDGKDESSPAMEQHLLEAADRYGMQRLKLMCEETLSRYIGLNTVAITLALAEQHHCQGLEEVCFNFLKSSETLNAVKETDGFQHLVKSCPSVVFELVSKLAAR
ncbi:hypothetical protein QOZ80_2AG0124840 [Eleusine coracana subsp. coracana]|nr:hypothetical protein QOZ80_2AG0124840 [Eleusine coracana subsp. coracana]